MHSASVPPLPAEILTKIAATAIPTTTSTTASDSEEEQKQNLDSAVSTPSAVNAAFSVVA